MTPSVRDVMTPDPVMLPTTASMREAAECMKTHNIGDVIVTDGGRPFGVLTDRDIVVRGVAENRSPGEAPLLDLCSQALVTVAPTDTTDDAVRVMRDHALRRLIVMEGGEVVGIVSVGDMAVELDPESALADISAAPPDQ